jgi:hypothetical protein
MIPVKGFHVKVVYSSTVYAYAVFFSIRTIPAINTPRDSASQHIGSEKRASSDSAPISSAGSSHVDASLMLWLNGSKN